MKIKSVAVLMILSLMFLQCKKDKNEKPAPDLNKGLLAYFRLNDSDFSDSTKNIQKVSHGGLMNSWKNRFGYPNRCIVFFGGFFEFNTDGWPGNPITVSLWLDLQELTNENFLLFSHQGAFGVYQSKSKLGLSIGIPATGSALADIDTGWTHFAGTYDGKDIKTYIDGRLVKTFHHPGTPDVTSRITVGAKEMPEWHGTIDDLRFYNRVLSADEIKLLSEL